MTICRDAIDHRPESSDAYAADETTVHVRLRTKRGDVDRVRLLYGDKFDWPGSASRTSMNRIRRDARFDYWQVAVEPPYRRLCYAFHVADGDESCWFTEWGFEPGSADGFPTAGSGRPLHYFEYPFLHAGEVIDPPEWAENAVFYQIFPERFENGDPDRDPANVEPWGERPTRESVFGGDLQGIIDRLDYLEDLGVTALYLTPVFEAPSNHKYDTADYTRIDPAFGDEETLRRLVSAAHDRGIRVVLDAVFNHCGWGFEPFRDVLERGADSEYADWFHVHEFPVETDPPNYDAFAFEPSMPKLNTATPAVREYLIDVATGWIEAVDADGWRLDVADEVDHDFWRELRREVKAVKPDAYLLGEVWHDARPWLEGDQFDAAMNYPLSYAMYDFLAYGTLDAEEFMNRVDRFLMRYPDRTNGVMFNLLGSHDTPRLRRRLDGDRDRLRLALFLLFTFRGAPCLYYGDEVGMTGGNDPDCRRPMVWDHETRDGRLHAFVRDLLATRTEHAALRRGELRFDRERSGDGLLVYRRLGPDVGTTNDDGPAGEPSDVVVAINRGDEPATVSVAAAERSGDWSAPEPLITTERHEDGDRQVTVGDDELVLPPTAGVVLPHSTD